jgi:CheY-like chemotaxis protein
MSFNKRLRRLLIVENRQDLLKSSAKLLKARGYDVLTASNAGDALEIVRNKWVHLVVIDARLDDDEDETDESGILLALHRAMDIYPRIIYTGFFKDATAELVAKHSGSMPARIRITSKLEKDPEVLASNLLKIVDNAFTPKSKGGTGDVGINFEQEPLKAPVTSVYLVGLLKNPPVDDEILLTWAHEMEDLLGKAFPDNESLVTGLLTQGKSGSFVLVVTPMKDGYEEASLILKCGLFRRIHAELANYEEHVRWNPSWAATLNDDTHNPTETLHLACLKYRIAGAGGKIANTISFAEFYRQNTSIKVITETIERLFMETMDRWYSPVARHKSEMQRSIFSFYEERALSTSRNYSNISDPHQLWSALEQYVSSTLANAPASVKIEKRGTRLHWQFDDRFLDWPDPYIYISGLRSNQNGTGLFPLEYEMCRCHGDLHAENLRIDLNKQVWMIDFEYTGWGPILQDPVELESSIRFTLLRERQLDALLKFEETFAAQESLLTRQTLPAELQADEHADLVKAFEVILALRHQAGRVAGAKLADYLLGLTYQAFRIIISDRVPTRWDARPLSYFKTHALFLASACCHKLEALAKPPSKIGKTLGISEL